MTRRSLVVTIGSVVLALALLVALVIGAQVDLKGVLRLLADVRPLPVLALIALTALHALLAAEKWRLVEGRLTRGTALPRRLCFAFTAIGMAAGQVLPMQVATALTRSLGARIVTGSGAMRGALATVFEQMFDVIVAVLCGLVSLACLWRGDLRWWAGGAAAVLVVCMLTAGPAAAAAGAATAWLAMLRSRWAARLAQLGRALTGCGLFDATLARRLFVLSVLRMVVLWLMAVATTQSVGLDISLLQLAAALPLVVVASALALTPANIGINEWTFAAAFTAFGADFEVAAQWALVNRVLVAVAALAVGGIGAALTQMGGKPAAPAPAH